MRWSLLLLLLPCCLSSPATAEDNLPTGRTALLLRRFQSKINSRFGLAGDVNPSSLDRDFAPEDDGTELSKNRAVAGKVLEGDIVPTEQQLRDLLAEQESEESGGGRRRFRRKIIKGQNYRWPTTIDYAFQLNDWNVRRKIREALHGWERETCLRFREVSRATGASMYFMRGGGCYSNVGKLGMPQAVSIGTGCDTYGIIQHEVGHALGLWHEQSRPMRDNYVSINFGNIISGTQFNFEKKTMATMDDYGVPYDMGSVMHYGPKGFAIRFDLNVISTRDPNYQNTIGQRESVSFIDVKTVNKAYCDDRCTRSLSCRHGGYPDPNNCNKCKCPAGLGGTTCDRAAQSTPGCGGELTATQDWKELKIGTLQQNKECIWRIKSNNGARILWELKNMNFPERTTCDSYVEVKDGRNFQQTGPRFCGNRNGEAGIWSSDDEMIIIYRTNNWQWLSSYKGFTARFKASGSAPRRRTARPTPRSTPRPPPPTSQPAPSAKWGAWTAWAQCSQSCGGCGVRERWRSCSRWGACSGDSLQKRECNTKPCVTIVSGGAKKECDVRLGIPCGKIKANGITFDPKRAGFAVKGLPSNFPSGRTVVLKKEDVMGGRRRGFERRKRQTNRGRTDPNRTCYRKFHYDCSTVSRRETCCGSYRLSNGVCRK